MRKATMCLLVALCSLVAFGQNQPQWKVVQSVILTQQTAAISQTTIFTPERSGLYRLNAYISGKAMNNIQFNPSLNFYFMCSDRFQQGDCGAFMGLNVHGPHTQYIGSYVFSPRPGTPVSYLTSVGNPPPMNLQYDLAFTIEQLQ
jgi:hypothetical protein